MVVSTHRKGNERGKNLRNGILGASLAALLVLPAGCATNPDGTTEYKRTAIGALAGGAVGAGAGALTGGRRRGGRPRAGRGCRRADQVPGYVRDGGGAHRLHRLQRAQPVAFRAPGDAGPGRPRR